MLGYLGREDLTDEIFLHGGYNTGDIGHVDDDGFIFITGRTGSFSPRLGGEMVPMDLVEEKLMEGTFRRSLEQITTMNWRSPRSPTRAKGERLLLIYTSLRCAPRELLGPSQGSSSAVQTQRARCLQGGTSSQFWVRANAI